MSKDQKKTITIDVETVEKLKFVCKLINETRDTFHYWKVDEIWPVNLYTKALERCTEILNQIIFTEEIKPDKPEQFRNIFDLNTKTQFQKNH